MQPYKASRMSDPPRGAAVNDELRRIEHALLTARRTGALLQGTPTAVTVGTTPATLVNYGSEWVSPSWRGLANDAAGTITVPEAGFYDVGAFASGSLSGAANNQQVALQVDINGTTQVVVVTADTSNQIASRAFGANLVLRLQAGDVLSLQLLASASMGTWTFGAASFEVIAI